MEYLLGTSKLRSLLVLRDFGRPVLSNNRGPKFSLPRLQKAAVVLGHLIGDGTVELRIGSPMKRAVARVSEVAIRRPSWRVRTNLDGAVRTAAVVLETAIAATAANEEARTHPTRLLCISPAIIERVRESEKAKERK